MWVTRIFMLPHTLIGIGSLIYLLFLMLCVAFGKDISAVVTSSEITHSRKGGTHYLLHYRYHVGERTKSGTGSVSWEVYQYYQTPNKTDSPVTVHYFSLGPLAHSSLNEGNSQWAEIGFVALWAGFWNFIVFLFLQQYWIKPLQRRLLYKNGEATGGTVRSKRLRTGRNSAQFVSYAFNDPRTGQLIEAEMQVWNGGAWSHATAGQPVTVLYAPDNPKRNTVYELGGYRVEGEH
jgi:hypothetical protein